MKDYRLPWKGRIIQLQFSLGASAKFHPIPGGCARPSLSASWPGLFTRAQSLPGFRYSAYDGRGLHSTVSSSSSSGQKSLDTAYITDSTTRAGATLSGRVEGNKSAPGVYISFFPLPTRIIIKPDFVYLLTQPCWPAYIVRDKPAGRTFSSWPDANV